MRLILQAPACLMVIWMFLLFSTVTVDAQKSGKETNICLNCNYENALLYKFCVNCGRPLIIPKKNPQIMKKKTISERKQVSESKSKPGTVISESQKSETRKIEKVIYRHKDQGIDVPQKKPAILKKKNRLLKMRLQSPLDPPRLFNIPTAEVLGSLDLNLTGGGTFGMEKERTFLGKIGVGLGNVAEIELSSLSLINALQSGITTITGSAFKMTFWTEKKRPPAIAMALGGTPSWNRLEGDDKSISFETRLMKLYLVATKRFGKTGGHFGVSITDVRVKNTQRGWYFLNPSEKQLKRNLFAIFCGTDIWVNSKTKMMLEIETVPRFGFVEGGVHDKSDISNVWAGMIGVRFFFTKWMALDTGMRYQSDYAGIADSKLQVSMNIFLPVGQMFFGQRTK